MRRRGRAWPAFFVFLAASLLLGGCSIRPDWVRPQSALELAATPFFPQTEHHCGPAALATVLVASGVQVQPAQLAALVYVPGREGSLQAEMIAAARRHQRVPYLLAPIAEALIESLSAGQPVLVLQNLGLRRWPRWHYAVVIGYDAAGRDFLLRSGTTRREVISERRFLRSWDLAQGWALTMARPDAVPVFATPERWIAATAPFESLGGLELAVRAYAAAVARWPDSVLGWQALANARYALGDREGAEAALRSALALDPAQAASANNYATLLLERGCPRSAQAVIAPVTEVPPRHESDLRRTREAIAAALGAQGIDPEHCPR